MKKSLLLLICLSLCFASYGQKGDVGLFVYDYEKVSDAFFACDIYICTTNSSKREVVVEIKGVPVFYSKEKTKEFADGIQSIINSKPEKTKTGKRNSMFILSDGLSSVYFDEKGTCLIQFGATEKAVTTQESAKKVMDGLKLAYDKL